MITLIAAMTKKRVIGKDGKLPWHIPDDLKNFKRVTEGKTVVMGMNTFRSIGRTLPNRNNIILSRKIEKVDGADVCNSVEEALNKARSYGKEIIIIGGAVIYEQFLPIADRMIISHVKKDYDGNKFFPEFSLEEWKIERKEEHEEFDVVYYKRKNG